VIRSVLALTLLGVAALASPSGSTAQWRAPYGAGSPQQTTAAKPPLTPTLLSLALPGAGQHVLGQRRKWAYLALEVAGWAVYLERRAAGGDYRDRYRDFAWDRARLQSGARVDGDFAYYETLSKWARSGAFDADPGLAGVQPEPDPATYNGSIWSLASQIFLPSGSPVPETDPTYQAALAYYQERAYATVMLWDWTGALPGQREELGRLIEAGDDRFRQATTALGIVIANHLLSAGDAYLAARGLSSPARLRLVQDVHGAGGRWSALLSVAVGR
jgi:hypothetical protein